MDRLSVLTHCFDMMTMKRRRKAKGEKKVHKKSEVFGGKKGWISISDLEVTQGIAKHLILCHGIMLDLID